jgi:hypothetical protein
MPEGERVASEIERSRGLTQHNRTSESAVKTKGGNPPQYCGIMVGNNHLNAGPSATWKPSRREF